MNRKGLKTTGVNDNKNVVVKHINKTIIECGRQMKVIKFFKYQIMYELKLYY